MSTYVTDYEIEAMIAEVKALPDDYWKKIQTKPKRGHRERELEVVGAKGSQFRVILRQSSFNPLDFSVILAWIPPHSTTPFRLRRYNGRSHEHTNALESQTFYAFHVHQATERYQRSGLREDAFAEPTVRYQDLAGALDCLIRECGFQMPPDNQLGLFDSEVTR